MGLSDAGDMRRQENFGVGPERMVFGQRFGIRNVDHRTREPAFIERIEECAVIELSATSGVNKSRAIG